MTETIYRKIGRRYVPVGMCDNGPDEIDIAQVDAITADERSLERVAA